MLSSSYSNACKVQQHKEGHTMGAPDGVDPS